MDKELSQRVNRLSNDIRELKSNSIVSGDSWVVYRTEIIFEKSATNFIPTPPEIAVYQIDFIPDEQGSFVARAYVTLPYLIINGDEFGVTPDPNYQGRWYDGSGIGAGGDAKIIVYSTKKGRLVVTPLSQTASA